MCCGTYRLLSVFWIHPLLCILCIWPGASLLHIQSITLNLCATGNDWKWTINSWFTLTQFMFTFLKSILCGVKCPRMADEYFGAITKENNEYILGYSCLFAVLYSQSSGLTVPFCTHLASSPDVEPALPLHQQALLSSEARWLGTGVYTCKTQQTTRSAHVKCPGGKGF